MDEGRTRSIKNTRGPKYKDKRGAKEIAIEHIKLHHHLSQPFRKIIAELLNTEKGTRESKRKKVPPFYYEIGVDFLVTAEQLRKEILEEKMRAGGKSPSADLTAAERKHVEAKARKQVAENYRCSETTVRTALNYFKNAVEEHDKKIEEETGERVRQRVFYSA